MTSLPDRDLMIADAAMADLSIDYAAGVSQGFPDAVMERYRDGVSVVIPIVVSRTLAPIREMHYPASNDPNRTPICAECEGRAGTHPCGCWRDHDEQPVCGVCNDKRYGFVSIPWPCPTVQLTDRIEHALTEGE